MPLCCICENTYACGEVVGPYQFNHMVEYQAVIATLDAFVLIKKRAALTLRGPFIQSLDLPTPA